MISVLIALMVCAFVYVIKETLINAGEDDFDYY